MATKTVPAGTARRPRSDAMRNRERILETAREVFTEHGADATLDDIARRAEVGPGTLYRHFPNRDALIEEVYRHEVQKLAEAGVSYMQAMQPLEALRAWVSLFIDHVAKKWLILPVMDSVPGGSARLIESSRDQIHGTFRRLVQRAIDSHDLRADIDPDDLMRALIGLFHTTSIPGWEASARRIFDLLVDGART